MRQTPTRLRATLRSASLATTLILATSASANADETASHLTLICVEGSAELSAANPTFKQLHGTDCFSSQARLRSSDKPNPLVRKPSDVVISGDVATMTPACMSQTKSRQLALREHTVCRPVCAYENAKMAKFAASVFVGLEGQRDRKRGLKALRTLQKLLEDSDALPRFCALTKPVDAAADKAPCAAREAALQGLKELLSTDEKAKDIDVKAVVDWAFARSFDATCS